MLKFINKNLNEGIAMNNNIDERILEEVKYFLTHENATIRTTAKEFGVSKSTVYIDLTTRLEPYILLYPKVREKLDKNKKERARRGGKAKKQKYLKK